MRFRLSLVPVALGLLAVACDGGEPLERASPPAATTSPAATPPPASPATAPPSFSWARLADAPTPRLEVAAAAVGGKLYLAGGIIHGGGITDVLEIYDPATDSWSRGPDLPEAVHHAMGVQFEGDFVVLGGFLPERMGAGGLFDGATARVWRLHERRWIRLPSLNHARGAAAAAAVGDRIVVAGGQGGARLVPQTEVFDGAGWRAGAPIPTPRDHVAAAGDGRFLYVAGGRELSIESVLPAFERYDRERDRWERLPDLPTPRGGFGAAFVNGTVVTVGGEGPAGIYPQVEAYGVPDRVWSRLPRMPQARHGMGVAAIGDRVYVAVGGPVASRSFSRRLEVLNLG